MKASNVKLNTKLSKWLRKTKTNKLIITTNTTKKVSKIDLILLFK